MICVVEPEDSCVDELSNAMLLSCLVMVVSSALQESGGDKTGAEGMLSVSWWATRCIWAQDLVEEGEATRKEIGRKGERLVQLLQVRGRRAEWSSGIVAERSKVFEAWNRIRGEGAQDGQRRKTGPMDRVCSRTYKNCQIDGAVF